MTLLKRLAIDYWGGRQDNFDWRVYQRPLEASSFQTVCVLHLSDRLGDAIVISSLVSALAQTCPEVSIYVGTTTSYGEYWRRHAGVREVAVFPVNRRRGRTTLQRVAESLRAARRWRGVFDVVVSFESYPTPDHFAFLRSLRSRVVVGFNKHSYRLFEYSLDEGRHGVFASPIVMRTASVMKALGFEVDVRALDFHVPFDREDDLAAQGTVDRVAIEGPRLLFNAYGAASYKLLSESSVVSGVRELRRAGHLGPIYLSVPAGKEEAYEKALLHASLHSAVLIVPPTKDFFEMFALVSKMDVVVSPDTAVSHVAAAFDKPQVCLFAQGGSVPIVWRPFSERCFSVVSTSGKNVNDLRWEEFGLAASAALALLKA